MAAPLIHIWSPSGKEMILDAAAVKGVLGIVSGTTPAANGTTPVAVAAPAVTATCQISLTIHTSGGTPGGTTIVSKTPGTGFSFHGVAGDTSTYDYTISP